MGSGSFDAGAYRAFTSKAATKTRAEVFSSRGIHKNLNPKGVKIRESRDSADNPNSTPLIVAIDVTGSMGIIAEVLAKKGLGILFEEVLKHKPITDPHLMFMAIGDAACDQAPLQVSQFEADNRIVEQLTQIFLEGGGGGNKSESYNLPWYFAANHTVLDSYEKRGKKGYLFTVGDEEGPSPLTQDQILEFIGDNVQGDQSSESLLAEVERTFDVFHIIVEEGDYCRRSPRSVFETWTKLLGQRVIKLSDHTKLAETIVAAIEMNEGGSHMRDITPKRERLVYDAVKHLPPSRGPKLLPA